MKFKIFDIADVFGPDDVEQAKGYVGMLGYFENDLEDLDNSATYLPERVYKLVRIKQTDKDNKYVIGSCGFKYFLPLRKVKSKEYTCDFKTEPTGKDINYRPCKNLIELMDLLDEEEHGSCLVGTTICIRHKLKTRMIETSIITSVKRDCDDNWLLYLGDKFHSLVELFNHYDILLKGRYQPFGVKVDE